MNAILNIEMLYFISNIEMIIITDVSKFIQELWERIYVSTDTEGGGKRLDTTHVRNLLLFFFRNY